MFRRLLIWIVMLALPLQSFAALGMIHCDLSHQELTNAVSELDHHMSADQHSDRFTADAGLMENESHQHRHRHHADAHPDTPTSTDDHHSGDSDSSHHVHKTACCAGAVALTASSSAFFPPAGSLIAGLYDEGILPTVFLEGPQRPPRSVLA